MNPPVGTIRRGTKAYETYPTPSGRHLADYPIQLSHAASVQFEEKSRQRFSHGNAEQYGREIYGQYRKTGQYLNGYNSQYNPTTLKRPGSDGRKSVTFEDDQKNVGRQQIAYRTVQRPRSANITSQRESFYSAENNQAHNANSLWRGSLGQGELRNVQRPHSASMSSEQQNVYSSSVNQQRDLQAQWAMLKQYTAYATGVAEQGDYNRSGYVLNQTPQQNGGYWTGTSSQPAGNGADYRSRRASHGATYSAMYRQQARAQQQRNGYEDMNAIQAGIAADFNRKNVARHQDVRGSSPQYGASRQQAASSVNYNDRVAMQQKTAHNANYCQQSPARQQNGYEEMRPRHFRGPYQQGSSAAQPEGTYGKAYYRGGPKRVNQSEAHKVSVEQDDVNGYYSSSEESQHSFDDEENVGNDYVNLNQWYDPVNGSNSEANHNDNDDR